MRDQDEHGLKNNERIRRPHTKHRVEMKEGRNRTSPASENSENSIIRLESRQSRRAPTSVAERTRQMTPNASLCSTSMADETFLHFVTVNSDTTLTFEHDLDRVKVSRAKYQGQRSLSSKVIVRTHIVTHTHTHTHTLGRLFYLGH